MPKRRKSNRSSKSSQNRISRKIKFEPIDDLVIKYEPPDEHELPDSISSKTVVLHENDINREDIESQFGLVSQLEFIKSEINIDETEIDAFREEIFEVACKRRNTEDTEQLQQQTIVMESLQDNIDQSETIVLKLSNERKKPSAKEDAAAANPWQKRKKMIKCVLCDFTTTTRHRHLHKMHMRMHTGERPFKCFYCTERFINSSRVHYHIKSKHPTKRRYQCKLCKQIFYKSNLFAAHQLNCVKTRSFECHLCKNTMNRLFMHKVKYHMRLKHTGETIYRCKSCDKRFISKASLLNHMQNHPEATPYQCFVCNRRYKKKIQLMKHEQNCKARRRLECHICKYSYVRMTIEGLKMHMRKHTGEKPFQCHLCSKFFPRTEALAQHLQRHPNALKYQCPLCYRRFINDDQVEQHKLNCKKRRYECYLCQFTRFGLSFSKFRRHMLSHIGEKLKKCSECSKSFSSKNILAHHIIQNHKHLLAFYCLICYTSFSNERDKKIHQNDCTKRRIECYLCQLTLKNIKDLNSHMVCRHTKTERFHCKLCPRKFQMKTNLDNHMKSHANCENGLAKCQYCNRKFIHIKYKKKHEFRCRIGYECYLCKMKFPSFAILHKEHMKIHLGEKPYDCKHCIRKFASIRCHNLHVMRYHLHAYKFQCNICHRIIAKNQDVRIHQKNCMKYIRQSVGIVYFKCSLCGCGLGRVPDLRKHILLSQCKNHPKKKSTIP